MQVNNFFCGFCYNNSLTPSTTTYPGIVGAAIKESLFLVPGYPGTTTAGLNITPMSMNEIHLPHPLAKTNKTTRDASPTQAGASIKFIGTPACVGLASGVVLFLPPFRSATNDSPSVAATATVFPKFPFSEKKQTLPGFSHQRAPRLRPRDFPSNARCALRVARCSRPRCSPTTEVAMVTRPNLKKGPIGSLIDDA